MELNLKNTKESFFNDLKEIYNEREVKSLFEMVCESVFGLSRTDLLLKDTIEVSRDNALRINDALNELKKGNPIQYILGEADFFDLKFKVNEHVLIPRQETEELIHLIIKNSPQANKILDVGTGSGIIPITLKKELITPKVFGLDVSAEALKVAKQNALIHKAEVSFIDQNILDESNWGNLPTDLDVLVSNPPYVLNSEKELMHHNVLEYEPHLALFVEDDNPLLFYKAITKFGIEKLKKGGALYFEINEQFGKETASLLKENFNSVDIVKDINGKDRFVYGIKD